MFVRLRTRLLVSSLITVSLVVALLAFILIERINANTRIDQLVKITSGAGLARELSLYVQYNAHNTNAYILGHLEYRPEVAQAVVGLGLQLGHVMTGSTLQSGIAMTLGRG